MGDTDQPDPAPEQTEASEPAEPAAAPDVEVNVDEGGPSDS